MTRPFSSPARACALAALALLALSAAGCGRRGPLEPPPDAAAPVAAPPPAATPAPSGRALPADRRLRPTGASTSAAPTTLATQSAGVVADSADDDDEDETETALSVSPSPTPRKRTRAYTVPNEPFALDFLL